MRVPGDRVPCVDVLKTLSQAVAKAVGKSEQVVMCSLATDRPMIFSGSTEPCAYGWFMSVGAIGGEKNKTISAAICEVLATQLSIPAARVYIEAVAVAAEAIALPAEKITLAAKALALAAEALPQPGPGHAPTESQPKPRPGHPAAQSVAQQGPSALEVAGPARQRSPTGKRLRLLDPLAGPMSRSPDVRYGLPPAGRTPPRVGTQLFVAGINFIINEQDLERKFSRYGRVKEARVVRHPMSGESRGFAFVVMTSEAEAEDAVRDMNGRDWNGRRLLVEIARNPRP
ncbi:hypothetical protein PLESTM_001435700 [Pleodorina starrii]|nr:hypothetical protein PLESTM_001435700 [Pleodorina starrii]